MDEFKEISGCPGYYINEKGDILSRKRIKEKLLSQYLNKYGYKFVILSVDGYMKPFYTSRLILSTFKGYPADPNLCFVKYVDGDMSNCCLSNLEWTICETTEDYDPSKSKRKGVLRPDHTKERMTEAKKHQSRETIEKAVLSRHNTYEKRKEKKRKEDLERLIEEVKKSNGLEC